MIDKGMTTFKPQTSSQPFALMFLVETCREPESSSWSSVTLAKPAGYRKAGRVRLLRQLNQ